MSQTLSGGSGEDDDDGGGVNDDDHDEIKPHGTMISTETICIKGHFNI